MSSLRFVKAPPCPEHINSEAWQAEWAGLMVGLASVFPLTIGYLGEGSRRIFDAATQQYRDPTAPESLDYITNKLAKTMWISRGALIHTCRYSLPSRPTILAWLDEDNQKDREYFAVPDWVATYLP